MNWQNMSRRYRSLPFHWKTVKIHHSVYGQVCSLLNPCAYQAVIYTHVDGDFIQTKIASGHSHKCSDMPVSSGNCHPRSNRLHIWVEPIPTVKFFNQSVPESSQTIRDRVQNCRNRQTTRDVKTIHFAAMQSTGDLWEHCQLSTECKIGWSTSPVKKYLPLSWYRQSHQSCSDNS